MNTSRKRSPGEGYAKTVATRLRATREEMGLNQTDFAELGGVRRSSQILYEGVDRFPDTLYFENLQLSHVDIGAILCASGATNSLNPPPSVLQRIFMITAGIDDLADPRVVLFQTLCAACVGRSDPDEVNRIYRALSQFRQAVG